MKTWLFNPFKYIAGVQALAIGLFLMSITLAISNFSGMHFDGAIDAHVGSHYPLLLLFFEHILAWGIPVLVFYALAFILTRSHFRLIDIAGTLALARGPMILTAVMGFIPAFHSVNPTKPSNTVLMLGMLMLIPLIWMIILMYNAFTTSFNLKGTKAIVGFIAGLFIAEIIAVYLTRMLPHLITI